ncbi:polyprenyl synthetase family protein [Streptomyces sp. NPDC050636]|uniref:polyprenyl synthetase family protein n=1 Tax=Streptomyces sp. NPDC050636 TaxID=3154510 RepID=UPI00343607C6
MEEVGLTREGCLQRQKLRLQAAEWYEEVIPQAEIARWLGASRQVVHVWHEKGQNGGIQALHSSGPSGRRPLVSEVEFAQVAEALKQGHRRTRLHRAGIDPGPDPPGGSGGVAPLGEAFPLRDDLLGVFGHPGQTGKPALDDLCAGKHTVLIATALTRATGIQRRTLQRHFGNPHLTETDADEIRSVVTATGARPVTEHLIAARRLQALSTLDTTELHPAGAAWLRHFARAATIRIT